MSEQPGYPDQVRSIESVVRSYIANDGVAILLSRALVEREEALADILRLAGQQFGLFPEIVAEVLAQVQMGQPISPEQRQMVHNNFHALMQRLHDEQQGGQG